MTSPGLWSVDYEVYGDVQGVFFRKKNWVKVIQWPSVFLSEPNRTPTGTSEETSCHHSPFTIHSLKEYTEEQAKRVAVVGWVKNTAYGTVTGQVQGSKEKVDVMKNWLINVGSPMSRIDKAVFSNERQIQDLGYSSFKTKY
ncbi:acylphosphatase-2-like isoform 1-T1 [Anomaloglossus baeobatrachus]|uniref:acylphosphatase-2-like isoform X1 n=1 Tax=Anomaloglossus baeobatrachus TaxID=238106 RepID=UPI003F4FB002